MAWPRVGINICQCTPHHTYSKMTLVEFITYFQINHWCLLSSRTFIALLKMQISNNKIQPQKLKKEASGKQDKRLSCQQICSAPIYGYTAQAYETGSRLVQGLHCFPLGCCKFSLHPESLFNMLCFDSRKGHDVNCTAPHTIVLYYTLAMRFYLQFVLHSSEQQILYCTFPSLLVSPMDGKTNHQFFP